MAPVVSPPSIKKLHSQYYFILILNLYSQSEILVIQKGRPQPISGLVDSADNCTDLMPHTLPLIVKSCSLPNIKDFLCPSKECSTLKHFAPHLRSSDDLQILGMWEKDTSDQNIDAQVMQKQERYADLCKMEETDLRILWLMIAMILIIILL